MNAKVPRALPRDRARRRERKLWHNTHAHTGALGCVECPTREQCGGISVGRSLYSCLDYCCGGKEHCDTVCRFNNHYVDRVREVNSFSFENVPPLRQLSTPTLPRVVPLLFHRHSRSRALEIEAAAVPLSLLVDHRLARARYRDISDIRRAFLLGATTKVVVTGTATDPPLERWWALGRMRRIVLRALKEAGVYFATAPNFSLFSDQPRWDDLHSMKRIAIAHEEFLSEGIPCALHVNSRTDRDIERWAEYIAARPEIEHISYEFLTGSGWSDRREKHAEWLISLAKWVNRPLSLTMRGAIGLVPSLATAFEEVTIIDATAFMKAVKRQQATPSNQAPRWTPVITPIGAPVDGLLNHNIAAMERWIRSMMPTSSVVEKRSA